ncbi:type II toxin-antitoxin system RelE/ParE family toxin [Halovibrio variabilis]|uniref:type II toxin-antitoxin system RelE/ParE family toxin n=1 Tax=Halovibrio variabilis TaxID=31910 RepID=UPI002482C533|nr:type II toxin-antitoxin system RelE/ParE family toxin [Halovibrio variabilis]
MSGAPRPANHCGLFSTIPAYVTLTLPKRFIKPLKKRLRRLPQHSCLYRPGRVVGTREAVVHPNDTVVYRLAAGSIEIVNVLHARQEYP